MSNQSSLEDILLIEIKEAKASIEDANSHEKMQQPCVNLGDALPKFQTSDTISNEVKQAIKKLSTEIFKVTEKYTESLKKTGLDFR